MKTRYSKYAIIIGSSLLLIALIAGYAYGYIYNGFMVEGKENFFNIAISNAKTLFISGIMAWIVILILDFLVAWGLCKYYNRVNKVLSGLNSGLRIIYTIILAIAIFFLIQQIGVFSRASTISEKTLLIQSAFQSFDSIWSFGLIIFGFHLMVWGILSLKAHFIPKAWGFLLIVAGLSYSFIHSAQSFALLPPDTISSIEYILMLPMTIAEVGIAIWFLVKRNM